MIPSPATPRPLTVRYLSRADVEAAGVTMREVIDAVQTGFLEKGNGRVEMPPKPGVHPGAGDNFIHAMPAYIPEMKAAGMKWVGGYPGNQKRKLPYITGLMIMNDPETGLPLAVMDCTWITAKRTGAATAVAAKYLARKDSVTVAILACGVQGRSNLEALLAVLPGIKEVRAYDAFPEVQKKYLQDAKEQYGLTATSAKDVQDAVRGADVIVSSGPILRDPTPALRLDWIKPNAFISPVDFDSYVQPEVFKKADKLYTDDVGQQAYYVKAGYFKQTPTPMGDLGELVSGKKPGRQSDRELTISVNLGLALEDIAVGIQVLRAAEKKGIGTLLNS